MKSTLIALSSLALAVTAWAEAPIKVFILAGQSNMEGAGKIEGDPGHNGGKGSLSYLAENSREYQHLKDKDGKWIERDDVSIWFLGREGRLAPGFGAKKTLIGPELGFGHVVGDAFDEPVLIIKTAWGGKSLAKDFRPPSSGGEVGTCYSAMLQHINDVLGKYESGSYEIAGFAWHQGWNDGCGMPTTLEYEQNLANFIRDIRKDLGVEKLPFVIADSGFGGEKQMNERRLKIRAAQAAPAEYPEFKGNVVCVRTAPFFRSPEESPSQQGYHWNGNAETYYRIGEAMGKAMKALCNQ